MSRRFALIINPVSGGYSQEKVRGIMASLEAAGLVGEFMPTGCADDATSFAREVCREWDEPLIIAGGGDGTVNGVVNGMAPGKGTLAVLPLGTANVLARELGICSAEDAVARIVRGIARRMTIGVLRGVGIERRFLLMAGIGLDGRIVENVRESEKRRVGKGAYLLAAAREMARWDRERFGVVADSARIDCHSVIVCNAARYGGGFVLAPGADMFAPGFRVACIRGNSRVSYLRLVISVMTGRVRNNPDITVLSAGELTISGNRPVQVDGDYCCRAPVRITAEAGFCRLIV